MPAEDRGIHPVDTQKGTKVKPSNMDGYPSRNFQILPRVAKKPATNGTNHATNIIANIDRDATKRLKQIQAMVVPLKPHSLKAHLSYRYVLFIGFTSLKV
ncbi:hypothetical protein JCM33374_g4083 [Metschnikowia sp. JCM 33374]|nr:hypothetical protein JCM33374_g4083 [Metschnikowia sp. JCM 33374]